MATIGAQDARRVGPETGWRLVKLGRWRRELDAVVSGTSRLACGSFSGRREPILGTDGTLEAAPAILFIAGVVPRGTAFHFCVSRGARKMLEAASELVYGLRGALRVVYWTILCETTNRRTRRQTHQSRLKKIRQPTPCPLRI